MWMILVVGLLIGKSVSGRLVHLGHIKISYAYAGVGLARPESNLQLYVFKVDHSGSRAGKTIKMHEMSYKKQ